MSVDVNALFKQLELLQKQITDAVQSGNLVVKGPEPIEDDNTPEGARSALTRFHASVAANPDVIHKALENHSTLINDLYSRIEKFEKQPVQQPVNRTPKELDSTAE